MSVTLSLGSQSTTVTAASSGCDSISDWNGTTQQVSRISAQIGDYILVGIKSALKNASCGFENYQRFYTRNVNNPELLTEKIPDIPGDSTGIWGDTTTLNDKLSGGDIGNNGILSPSTVGKYYAVNGLQFYTTTLTGCIVSICEPRRIEYIMRNIYIIPEI